MCFYGNNYANVTFVTKTKRRGGEFLLENFSGKTFLAHIDCSQIVSRNGLKLSLDTEIAREFYLALGNFERESIGASGKLPSENVCFICSLYFCVYAQTLIVVVLIVVNFGGFLVIARNPPERF